LIPDTPPALRVTIQRSSPTILSGGTAEVVVAVARDGEGAFAGDVDVTMAPVDGITAAPLALDPTLGSGTLVVSAAVTQKHGTFPLAITARSRDGKIAGDAATTILVRGAPGALDTGFGSGGIATVGGQAEATGIAFQNDGKIILGGRMGSDPVLVRLTPDGALDPSFGAAGIARAPVPALASTNDVVLVTAGGGVTTLLLGGTAGSPSAAFVARFTLDGALDATYGGGVVTFAGQARSAALAPTPHFGVFVGGQSASAADKDAFQVLSLLPDGGLDPGWGDAGVAILPLAPAICPADAGACPLSALDAKSTGRLAACASRGNGVTVREIFPDGEEDKNSDFDVSSDVMSRCNSIVNNTEYDFYAAGARDVDRFAIVHFIVAVSGSTLHVDPVFALGDLPADAGIGAGMRVIIAGGGFLAVAATAKPAGAAHTAFALVHADAAGRLDPKFGDGKSFVVTPIGDADAIPKAIAVQGDHKVVVAGTSSGQMVAVRYWQ
jgi:uncharacterized delta-60 repeat protein